ncbi:hypothetical protein [Roseivirga ehrenbergii]|uniref:hypothetical protein n=1 Tax=Roseivirga ehrenbergii (strain DSM 102268 / JCM 13514 / KCTC 12282 / NCIMB 14502 / KMM 6017) TaxID=279360 RepID=UPI00104584F4|nr:hypothetical protein [Roseivirga ehrenbergii]
MNSIRLLLVFVLLNMVSSCKPQSYDAAGLKSFVLKEDHGLMRQHERKGYKLMLYNRPTDLWVAQELRDDLPTDSLITVLRKKYDNYLYFMLNISMEGKEALYASENFGTFSNVLQNLSFRMGGFTEMVTSQKDTIPVADSHYDRLYGQSGNTSVMIAFHKDQIKDTDWVQINIKDIGLGTGRTTYRFQTKNLLSVPQIDFLRNSITQ